MSQPETYQFTSFLFPGCKSMKVKKLYQSLTCLDQTKWLLNQSNLIFQELLVPSDDEHVVLDSLEELSPKLKAFMLVPVGDRTDPLLKHLIDPDAFSCFHHQNPPFIIVTRCFANDKVLLDNIEKRLDTLNCI